MFRSVQRVLDLAVQTGSTVGNTSSFKRKLMSQIGSAGAEVCCCHPASKPMACKSSATVASGKYIVENLEDSSEPEQLLPALLQDRVSCSQGHGTDAVSVRFRPLAR